MKHWTRLLIEMDAESACEHAFLEGYEKGREAGVMKGYETGYRQAMRHIDDDQHPLYKRFTSTLTLDGET